MGGFLRRSTFGIKKPFKSRGGGSGNISGSSDGGGGGGGSGSGGSSVFGGLMTTAAAAAAATSIGTGATPSSMPVRDVANAATGEEEKEEEDEVEESMTSRSAAAAATAAAVAAIIPRQDESSLVGKSTTAPTTLLGRLPETTVVSNTPSNVVMDVSTTETSTTTAATAAAASTEPLCDAAIMESNIATQMVGISKCANREPIHETNTTTTSPKRRSTAGDSDVGDDDGGGYFRASHDDSSSDSDDDEDIDEYTNIKRQNAKTQREQSGRTDADSAFLSALHVASSNPSSTLTNIRRQAYPPPPTPPSSSSTKVQMQHQNEEMILSKDRETTHCNTDENEAKMDSDSSTSKVDSMAHANAAFLGALRVESVPVGEEEDIRGMGSAGRGRSKPYYPHGSFVINPASKVKPLLPKQQHLAVKTSRDSSSTQSKVHHQENNNDASLDADSKFLMAIHGSQHPNHDDTSSLLECGETYNSGTLVINSPPTGGGIRSTTSSEMDTSNASFMSAIHAAADEDDGEDIMVTTDTTAVVAVEGETDSERENKTDADTDVDGEADDDDDDFLDEDITGITLPMHPYMEKVLLPRPLFFGHVLPPRIVAEAERAASAYATTTTTTTTAAVDSLDDTTTTANAPSSSFSQQHHQQSDSLTNADSESFAADDSSVISSMSLSSILPGGGKIFESSVAPCCRNFEGAMDVFGFGVNPFLAAHHNSREEHSVGVRHDEEKELATPHPYVSVYSPVWGEWGRTARAKARKRKEKIADEARAEIEARMIAEEAAKATTTVTTPIKSSDYRQDCSRPLSTPSGRRRHKKTASTDFSDLWSKFHSPSSSTTITTAPTEVSHQNDNADDLFLRYARSGSADVVHEQPKSSRSEVLSQDQFLMYARDGSTEVEKNKSAEGIRDTLVESISHNQSSISRGTCSTDDAVTENATVSEAQNPLNVLPIGISQDEFLQYASAGTFVETPTAPSHTNDAEISQDQFLQLVRVAGEADSVSDKMASGTFIGVDFNADSNNSIAKGLVSPTPVMNSNSFVHAVKFSSEDTSDNDFVEAAEERKTVGLNDNMSAAVAMLAGSSGVDDDDDDADVYRGIGAPVFLAAGGGSMAANKYGRPYSNLELTNGCTPLYGCDDPALPHESDLGIFETKEDEKRNTDRRREQHMIGQFASPGIMPHIACPTQCLDADDSTYWNARFSENESGYCKSGGNTMVISLDGHLPPGPDADNTPQPKSPLYEVSRIAWWNLPEGFDETGKARSKKSRASTSGRGSAPTPELFPALDDPIPLDVQTNLWPPLKVLRENNISCNRSHSATSTARFLPHLSDRPPSLRHLQIDTTAVGFPSLGGEIEPFFCQLAIFHFEMSAERIPGSSARIDSDSVSTSASSHSPSPNMERCGQVTEFLNFDIVQDPTVIKNCKNALWPYSEGFDIEGPSNSSPVDIVDVANCTRQSEGTSCGLFPISSVLSISNLYAVIIVNKVVAEHASEMYPYYKPSRRDSAHEGIDLETLRTSASKSCNKYGKILMPFAFGVVPLKHIIGDDSPKAPVSRAVQIPLFKFDVERGSQSIFDHILLMLHPRMEPRGGKVASMTRGHALLVMRYFGYLSVHSILKKRSSLAREHLVDITGELQVKCKGAMDAGGSKPQKPTCPVLGETFVLPSWRSQYQTEPAIFGGRNVRQSSLGESGDEGGLPKSLYAQELASLPLEGSISESTSRGSSKSSRSKYDGKLLHTSMCNELVCHPRILLNCTKKRIFIKVELRELMWSKSLSADIAIPLQPCIHNARRGPWLVQEVFSACAMGTPRFLDEFKIKLPMVLGAPGRERCGLLFSIFHLKAHGIELDASPHDTIGGTSSESEYVVEQLGSGFLPLTLENDSYCLIANGHHNVPIAFRSILLADRVDDENIQPSKPVASINSFVMESLTLPLDADESYPNGSLVLTPLQPHYADDDSRADDVNEDGSHSSTVGLASKISRSRSQSSLKDTFEDILMLQVAVIAITSVHPQNRALAEFFLTKPMPPRCLMPSDFSEPYVPWGKVRSEILYRLKPERIPPFNFVGGALAETERKMLEPVVSLTKSSKCPHSDLMTHLVRIAAQLWRTAVSGAGEPSILWAR